MYIPKYVILFVIHRCLCVDLTYYIEEGKSPRTLVGDIAIDLQLMDRETSQNENFITFTLLQQGVNGNSRLFHVSKNTGKLYTTKILDAESMCKREKECFQMIDIAIRKGTSFIKLLEIKVIIQDINDHQPEFPDKQVSIEFSEDDRKGAKRSIPNAVDKDIGIINSQITYQLKKNKDEPFTLAVLERVDGTSDLSILLKERLDRELKDSYMIQVIAKDRGSPYRQSILDVHITVMDVNDNIPVFTQKVYNISVNNEHERGIPVIVVSAKDLDSGKNGRITYHFSSKTSETAQLHFLLNKNTGKIFLQKRFSLGQELIHKLYIEATDGGNPPLNSIAMVLVNIVNQQNNPPTIDTNFVFGSTANTTIISEDIEVGSFIAYVKVTDHDVGQNGEIRCDLHHDKFQLQSLSLKKYKIILKSPVDRETEDHHNIVIKCHDQGSPPLYAEKRFSINIKDVNDVRPQFFKEIYRFKIDENQKSKIPVGFINATDPDLGPGGRLTYSLRTNNKEFLPFQITEDELISTISSLDHEFQDIYRFQVFVKDNGIPSLNNSVNVIVEVNDENDNAPYFTFPTINPFTMDVLYYPHHTKNITVLKASDSDSRENAFLKYRITSGNSKQLFTINPYTGLLSFTRVVTQQDAGTYDLEFTVKDSGTPVLSATTTIFFIVTVSNKTYEILNAVHIQSDVKIHLNLVVIITLIAVTVSVIITASTSICILRYCHRRHIPQEEITTPHRCVSEQRHLICPSYHTSSCTDVSGAILEQDKTKNSHFSEARRISHLGEEFGSGQRGSPVKPRTSTEFTHQV